MRTITKRAAGHRTTWTACKCSAATGRGLLVGLWTMLAVPKGSQLSTPDYIRAIGSAAKSVLSERVGRGCQIPKDFEMRVLGRLSAKFCYAAALRAPIGLETRSDSRPGRCGPGPRGYSENPPVERSIDRPRSWRFVGASCCFVAMGGPSSSWKRRRLVIVCSMNCRSRLLWLR